MNKEIFIGHLTKDFELHKGQNTNIARGGIALNRGRNRDGVDMGADFVNLVAFGRTADTLAEYGKKGQRMAFECHVHSDSYTNDEGKKVYTENHIIDRFEFASSKNEGGGSRQEAQPENDDFMSIPDSLDEELPFN